MQPHMLNSSMTSQTCSTGLPQTLHTPEGYAGFDPCTPTFDPPGVLEPLSFPRYLRAQVSSGDVEVGNL